MKKMFLVLLLGGCPADWTKRDSAMESVALTFTATDMMQTREITADCSEVNPIIGQCGERLNMYVYFMSVAAVEMVAVRLLPEDLRSTLLGGFGGAEAATIWDNAFHSY